VADTDSWIIEKLEKRHDRAAFSCGVEDLDTYLQKYSGQNEKAGLSQHFIAVATAGDSKILGYYALSTGAVAFEVIPDDLRKRLPKYPVPVAHLTRLAVDQTFQSKGLGEDLLMDALARISRISEEIGIHAIEVIAIDAIAKRFYDKYGFRSLQDDEKHMYLPMKAVKKLGL